MKTIVTLIIIFFALFSLSTFAQDFTQLSFPEGAKARLGKGTINDIAYSPDGTLLAVGGSAGIWLYDTATYKEVALLTEHKTTITKIVFSADGKKIAAAGSDVTVRVWNIYTGAVMHTFTGDTETITSIAFRPDGEIIAIAAKGYPNLRLWEITTGAVRILTENPHWLPIGVTFSPDGERLACVNYDNTIGLWHVFSGFLRNTLVGSKNTVTSVAFSPGRGTIATGGPDRTVRLWDHTLWGELVHKERSLKHTLTGHTGEITSMAFSPDGETIACASRYHPVLLWDVNAGTLIHTLTVSAQRGWGPDIIAFSPDGKTVAGGSEDSPIHLWDATTGREIPPLIHPEHTGMVNSVAFSPDGSTIASGSADTTIRLWDASTGRYIRTLTGHKGGVVSVAFSPDGNTLASGSINTILWDVHTGDIKHTLTGHSFGVASVAFSPDGDTVASVDHRSIRLWDARTGELERTFTDILYASVTSVAFSPDGDTIAAADHHAILRWDVHTGDLIHTLTEHTHRINSITFSPGGRLLASASQDTTVRLWSVNSGDLERTFNMEAPATSVAFSSDGETLAIGSGTSIMLLNIFKGQMHPIIEQRRGRILSLAFSPEGNTLVSGDENHTVLLWDAAMNGEIRPLTRNGHTTGVGGLLFSPDGSTIASVSGSTRLWDATTGEFIRDLPIGPAIAFSPDSSMLAGEYWLHDNIIALWDARTGTLIHKLTPPQMSYTSRINSIAFSSNIETVASASDDGIVRLWDLTTRTLIRTRKMKPHMQGGVPPIAFSSNGNTIASARDRSITLWDAGSGNEIRVLTHDKHNNFSDSDPINRIFFSPYGHHVVGVSQYDAVLWNTRTGTHIHMNPAVQAFSPDGGFIVGGTSLKSTRTGEDIRYLAGYSGRTPIVTFSPDGNTIAGISSGIDRTVYLWDAHTGSLIRTFTGHAEIVSSIAFNPDGRTLASGSYDGTVLLWELTPRVKGDVNRDGVVDIRDLVSVANSLGQTGGTNDADVNRDGVVDIRDLVIVSNVIGFVAAAPSVHSQGLKKLTAAEVKAWITQAQQMSLTTPEYLRGIAVLKQLQAALTPKETALFANYPNPFNPETWIPYQLANPADVKVHIYAMNGTLVRTLELGHQAAGMYQNRSRAAYWNGKNEIGEPIASNVYFYTLTAGEFSATRKMLILK